MRDIRTRLLRAAVFVVVFLALAVSLSGCAGKGPKSGSIGAGTTSPSGGGATGVGPSAATTATSGPTTSRPVGTTPPALFPVSTPTGVVFLSAEQLAGQRVIYSYTGLVPPPELLALVSRGEAAGIIFFKDNFASLDQIRSVVADLDAANESAANPVRAPLLLMTDQEGGPVRRLPGAPLLSEKQIGLSDDPRSEAATAGRGAASSLKNAGLNINLAPVLDVYRRAGGFIDRYGRSYSTDPTVVAELGAEFIKAQEAAGVAAAAKHFPGLGAATATENTDLVPVTLNLALRSLRSVDEAPYRAAIAVSVRLVMVSWAVYPAIDPDLPAGFSTKVVQGELRERLKFQGVTISDGLGAGALEAFGGFGQRGLRAARAGLDILLCSAASTQSIAQGDSVRRTLAETLRNGTLDKNDFEAAVARVLALRYGLAR